MSQQFKDLLTDTLLNHAGEVRHYDFDQPHDSLVLRRSDPANEGVEWSVSVEAKTVAEAPSGEWESAEEIQATIHIQRVENQLGREHFGYRLGSDGVVRRWDGGDAYAKIQQERAAGVAPGYLTGNETLDELREVTEARLNELATVHIPNARLEREMGLNDQPIGLSELQGLRRFMSQPGFEVPEIFAWLGRLGRQASAGQ